MIFRTSVLVMAFIAAVSASVDHVTYVVHMDQTKMKKLEDHHGSSRKWYETVLSMISEPSAPAETQEQKPEVSSPQLLYVYQTVLSGFAARLSAKHLQRLRGVDGFLAANRDQIWSLHTTRSPQFLGLQHGIGLWSPANLTTDVIIGLVDTGVWPEHESFRDSGMPPLPNRWKGICETGTEFSPKNCNKKLIGARAYYKGLEALGVEINEIKEYKSPRDAEGHGTHTASTAAGTDVHGANTLGLGTGTADGMRYTSRFAAYKACFANLGCAVSDIVAAMDQAVEDGVDILSLSLGGPPQAYDEDEVAIAAFKAVGRGVFVSFSAGNEGPFPSSVTNAAPWVMTVAASYTDRDFTTLVKLGDGQVFTGASIYSGLPTKQLPLVYGSTAGVKGAEGCVNGSLAPKLVQGKIVICEQSGFIPSVSQAEIVRMAGGEAMLSLIPKYLGEEREARPFTIPTSSLGAKAGAAILKYVNSSENPTASIEFKGTVFGDNPAPAMAAFSSRGPNMFGPDVLKPDVSAPGANILAAWPPNKSPSRLVSDMRRVQFNILSGTSMSCPHVSGLAALIKSVHSSWSPAAIKSALMTTAYAHNDRGAPIQDVSTGKDATPFDYGSGHVDPESAACPGLVYDISERDYLIYLCSLGYNSTQISLFYSGVFTCPGADLQPGDLNYPSFSVLLPDDGREETVTFKRTVTNVGKPTNSYSVKVTEPDGVTVTVKPQVLNFNSKGEKQSYRVSFSSLPNRERKVSASFGELVWRSTRKSVRSPIAVIWRHP